MLHLQSLKVFITQRLTEAVEEVIGRLERAITDYEEEMELRHHHRLRDAASKRDDEQRRAGANAGSLFAPAQAVQDPHSLSLKLLSTDVTCQFGREMDQVLHEEAHGASGSRRDLRKGAQLCSHLAVVTRDILHGCCSYRQLTEQLNQPREASNAAECWETEARL
ncbi:hypothetical protein INR49_000644 [Caranx melampygus]|nr:hypothetical protein INR49_000644 [Caranx melampygus]